MQIKYGVKDMVRLLMKMSFKIFEINGQTIKIINRTFQYIEEFERLRNWQTDLSKIQSQTHMNQQPLLQINKKK